MVSESKAKVVYRELLKEDLVVIRLVPEKGVPKYQISHITAQSSKI